MIRKKDFLICYDISDKKRLAKISKIIEKEALRIQRSVYFYPQASKIELDNLIERVLKVLDKNRDDLRIYTIKNNGIHLGSAINLDNPFIFT
jgi:CRISPR-associated protein Cas2